MKVLVKKGDLGFLKIGKDLIKENRVPILDYALFETEHDHATVTMISEEAYIKLRIECNIIEEGKALIPIKGTLKVIPALQKNSEIEIVYKVYEHRHWIELSHHSKFMRIETCDPDEFCEHSKEDKEVELIVDRENLCNAISNCLGFTSSSKNDILSHVCMILERNLLKVVSSCGTILCEYTIPVESGSTFKKVIGKESLKIVPKIMLNDTITIRTESDGNRISFLDLDGNSQLTTRVLDSSQYNFPSYNHIIPNESESIGFVVDRIDFENSLDFMSRSPKMANSNHCSIRIEVEGDKLTMATNDARAEIKLMASVKSSLNFEVNSKKLLSIIEKLKWKREIKIKVSKSGWSLAIGNREESIFILALIRD